MGHGVETGFLSAADSHLVAVCEQQVGGSGESKRLRSRVSFTANRSVIAGFFVVVFVCFSHDSTIRHFSLMFSLASCFVNWNAQVGRSEDSVNVVQCHSLTVELLLEKNVG